jgi:integrase
MQYITKVSGSNKWYYKRRIPLDVQSHYPDNKDKKIVKSLRTDNKKDAVFKASKLTRELEAEWNQLRGKGLVLSGTTLDKGRELLKQYGLPPSKRSRRDEVAFDLFVDSIEDSLSLDVQEEFHDACLAKDKDAEDDLLVLNLLPEQLAALGLSNGSVVFTASLILEEHLKHKGWLSDKKKSGPYKLAFADLIGFLGDRRPSEYRVWEVQELITYMIEERGLKTMSVKRRMDCIRAAFKGVTKHFELNDDKMHNFNGYDIPNLGDDAEDRSDFTPQQLAALRAAIAGDMDEIWGMIAVMMETGFRVSESCGLSMTDVCGLDTDYPFLTLHKTPFRKLKTKSSIRFIPLTGLALKYVRSVTGKWLFPRYIDEEGKRVKSDNGSAAAKKRIQSVLGPDAPTSHSFRHTMATRLRDAECPEDKRNEMLGWSSRVSDRYGNPSDISIKAKYLEKTLDWQGQGWSRMAN